MAYSKRIEELIKIAMADSSIDATEEKVLRKAAESEGLDPDEMIMNVRARIVQKNTPSIATNAGSTLLTIGSNIFSFTKKIGCLGWAGICVVLFFVWMCIDDKKENTVEGENGIEYSTDIAGLNQAISNNDFNAAHQICDKGWKKQEMLEILLTTEVQYLAADGSSEAIDRIAYLINSVRLGVKPQSGLVGYSTGEEYETNVKLINTVCDKVLDIAIANKNESLADKILLLYKDSIKRTEGSSEKNVVVKGAKVDGYHSYIEFVDTDYQAAKTRFKKAKKDGAFKK